MIDSLVLERMFIHNFFFVGKQEVHLCLIKLTLHILFSFYYFFEVAVKNLQSLYNDFLNTFLYLKFRKLYYLVSFLYITNIRNLKSHRNWKKSSFCKFRSLAKYQIRIFKMWTIKFSIWFVNVNVKILRYQRIFIFISIFPDA